MSEVSRGTQGPIPKIVGFAAALALVAACESPGQGTDGSIRPEFDACTRTQPSTNEQGYLGVRNNGDCAELMTNGLPWQAVNFTEENISGALGRAADLFGRASRGNVRINISLTDATEDAQQKLSEELDGAECISDAELGKKVVRSTMHKELDLQKPKRLIIILPQPFCRTDDEGIGGINLGSDIVIFRGGQFERALVKIVLHELGHPYGNGHAGSATDLPFGQRELPRDKAVVLSAQDLAEAVWSPYNGGFTDPMGFNIDVNDLDSALLNPVMLDQTLWPFVETGQREPLARVQKVGDSTVIDREAAANGSFVMSYVPESSTVQSADGRESVTFDRVALVPDVESRKITVMMVGTTDNAIQTGSRGDMSDATEELNVNGAVFRIEWSENGVKITRVDNS